MFRAPILSCVSALNPNSRFARETFQTSPGLTVRFCRVPSEPGNHLSTKLGDPKRTKSRILILRLSRIDRFGFVKLGVASAIPLQHLDEQEFSRHISRSPDIDITGIAAWASITCELELE